MKEAAQCQFCGSNEHNLGACPKTWLGQTNMWLRKYGLPPVLYGMRPQCLRWDDGKEI